ncbi:MAG: hypothetical protein JWR48_6440 [Mycobacterium sp.]|nr:hypothetical protein [Mycobacterium sp.]
MPKTQQSCSTRFKRLLVTVRARAAPVSPDSCARRRGHGRSAYLPFTCAGRRRTPGRRSRGTPYSTSSGRFGSQCPLQVGLELLQLRTHPGQSRIPPKSEVGQHTSAPYPINTNRVVAARATNLTQHNEDQADPVVRCRTRLPSRAERPVPGRASNGCASDGLERLPLSGRREFGLMDVAAQRAERLGE